MQNRTPFVKDGINDYLVHQRKLLPALATTYALHFAQGQLVETMHDIQGAEELDEDAQRELESRAAGLKVARVLAIRDRLRRKEYGDETTVPADPDPRVVLIQHLGLVSAGTTTKASKLSRDLYHRAIEVMAAHGFGFAAPGRADRLRDDFSLKAAQRAEIARMASPLARSMRPVLWASPSTSTRTASTFS